MVPQEMKQVADWRIRGLLLAFAAAAFVVGIVGCGVLWQSGYRSAIAPTALMPLAWICELFVYLIAHGRRAGIGAGAALLVGLFARAAMASSTALIWPEGVGWWEAFQRYYGSAWAGVLLQISMAALLVWFISDLAPAVAQLTAENRSTPPPSREQRGRLLDELMHLEEPAEQARSARVAAGTAPQRERVRATPEEAKDEARPGNKPETPTAAVVEKPKTAHSGEEKSEATAPTVQAREPAVPSAEVDMLSLAPRPVPEETEKAEGEAEEIEKVQSEDAREEALAAPVDVGSREAKSELVPTQPDPTRSSAPDEETSELAAVASVAPAGDVVGWAVAEAVRSALGVENAQPLPAVPGSATLVVTNAPVGSDYEALALHALTGAAALPLFVSHGLLGDVQMAAGLFRGGGMLAVPGSQAIVILRCSAPANLGVLAGQARRLLDTLEASWPRPDELVPRIDLPEVTAAEPPREMEDFARSIGQHCAAHRVQGLGTVMTFASAGCDHAHAAASAAAAWRAWSEFGRTCGQGGLRRLVAACSNGSAALGLGQVSSGENCLIARLAPQAQLGIAAAEMERLVQRCTGGAET